MTDETARGRGDQARPQALLNHEGPWSGGGGDDGPSNPWMRPAPKRPSGRQPSIEELIRRSRSRFGGGGGAGGPRATRPIWGYALGGFVLLWLATTSIHQIGAGERGLVTRFGRYAGTMEPGIGFSLPAPVDVVTQVDVDRVREFEAPDGGGQNLLLTADRGLIDLAYTVRWTVADPKLFEFGFARPDETIRAIVESAVREAVAATPFDAAASPGHGGIEARAQARAQAILDRYRSGVTLQAIAIRRADAPAAVAEAAKQVDAAQQQAQADIAAARTEAERTVAGSQAAAAAFDRVYDAYRLSPEVTRQRMYYETMEAVLAKTNKVIVPAGGAAPYIPVPIPQPVAKPPEPAPAAGNGQ